VHGEGQPGFFELPERLAIPSRWSRWAATCRIKRQSSLGAASLLLDNPIATPGATSSSGAEVESGGSPAAAGLSAFFKHWSHETTMLRRNLQDALRALHYRATYMWRMFASYAFEQLKLLLLSCQLLAQLESIQNRLTSRWASYAAPLAPLVQSTAALSSPVG
jgi:hypothetical protein